MWKSLVITTFILLVALSCDLYDPIKTNEIYYTNLKIKRQGEDWQNLNDTMRQDYGVGDFDKNYYQVAGVKVKFPKMANSNDTVYFDPDFTGPPTAYPALKVDGVEQKSADGKLVGIEFQLSDTVLHMSDTWKVLDKNALQMTLAWGDGDSLSCDVHIFHVETDEQD